MSGTVTLAAQIQRMQVFCGGDFGFMAKLSKFLPMDRPVTFLDAGANIGMASILFSQLIMGHGQVLSVEANPETAEVCKPAGACSVNDTDAQVEHAVTGRTLCRHDRFSCIPTLWVTRSVPAPFVAAEKCGMRAATLLPARQTSGRQVRCLQSWRAVQVLRSNLASLRHVAVPVQAALVDTATAEEKKTLTFKGRGSEYWGFRVDHNGLKQADTVEYEVETRTLGQIRVRLPHRLCRAAQQRSWCTLSVVCVVDRTPAGNTHCTSLSCIVRHVEDSAVPVLMPSCGAGLQ